MPPEQDPTQTVKAPSDGATPDNQAGPTGGGEDPPEGEGGKTTFDQAYVDRLKQQIEGGKQELTRVSTERDTYKGSAEILSAKVNTHASVAAPAPAPTIQYVEGTHLTVEENAALLKAQEDIVPEVVNKLQRLERSRETAQAQENMIKGIGSAITQTQSVGSVQTELNAAKEFNDPAIRQKLLLDTQTAMNDPSQVSRYAQGQINVAGIGINPHILLDKLKDYRIEHGAAVKKEEAKVAPEGHDALGGEGPSSAHPSSGGDTFDASTHLTASERSGAVKGMTLKGFPTSGMTEKGDAYNAIWKGLSEEVKAQRLAHGAPAQNSESGVASKTIWRAKKRA